MIKIIDKRDSGKTRKLLTECSKNDGVFICKHPERVVDKCSAYGLPLVESYSYEDFIYTPVNRKVYVDELDEFLRFLHIEGYCNTEE